MIILRTDLNMSVGKMISQACHACLESSEISKTENRKNWESWRKEGAKKVILKIESPKALLELGKKAKEFGIPFHLVEDRGLTEIPPGTLTALAIGPAPAEIVDRVTKNLSLL